MGNQPSKDGGLIDNTNQKRIRSFQNKSNKQQQEQLENNRVQVNKSTSSRLLQKRNKNNDVPVVVSPVRHQLVLTDHVTPLVSLSAASNTMYQRRSSGKDTRSMSSTTSITSEENEPYTPTFYHRSSYDEFANSFMQDIHLQQNKLSTSLPNKHSDEYTSWTSTARRSSSATNQRDSKEVWVYEYGAEKERDRYVFFLHKIIIIHSIFTHKKI
jgi:hypothetical protein